MKFKLKINSKLQKQQSPLNRAGFVILPNHGFTVSTNALKAFRAVLYVCVIVSPLLTLWRASEIQRLLLPQTTRYLCDCLLKHFPKEDTNNETNEDNHLINLVSDTLWELNDNIICHSSAFGKNKGFGFVYVQNYPNRHELKIAFVDTGIGIPESLRRKEKYSGLTKLEALAESMKMHATSKDVGENQQGMGLYNVDLFVQKNSGQIEVFSGDCYYYRRGTNSPEINVYADRFYWQGTAIFVTFKTDNKISYKELFGNKDNYFEVISNR